MRAVFKTRTAVLFIGDIFVFSAALWLSLFIRTFEVPSAELLKRYALAFVLLFTGWTLIFVVAGLYENRVLVHQRVHAPRLGIAHGVNILATALFFSFLPYFGIAPKTILVIYLLVSLVMIFVWRLVLFSRIFGLPRQYALLVGESPEMSELDDELRRTTLFAVERLHGQDLESADRLVAEINRRIGLRLPDLVILDIDHPAVVVALPALHKSMFAGVNFTTVSDAYEDVFGRVPLALMSDQWVIQNMSRHDLYDALKRVLDVVIGFLGFCGSLIVYPFVALAIRLEGPGPIFISQVRVGQYNRPITLFKFRSMERNDPTLSADKATNRITRVGALLRKSRIDELPQLFNVLRGDVSLIGPRPELPSGVELYDREISYYGLRYLIKPGLSGWAQLYHDAHPHHVADIEATKEKLSYDFYYMKHRSLVIDVLIVLKTIRKLAMQSGA